MWALELLAALCELVEFVDLIALILKGIGALIAGLVYLTRQLGRWLLEGAWWLLRFGH